ncbi:MAG: glycosyltransferase family 2 protein [Acetobacteraceae bacterium]|nr:glycosyltransferase family 2 protein [Acetobacteraceae bacterium]
MSFAVMMQNAVCSVAIFAHNEETRIRRCLTSLDIGAFAGNISVHVIANGCSDRTAAVARSFSAPRKAIHVHELALGDKANAWNYAVHTIGELADFYVFVDGDCWIKPGSLQNLGSTLFGHSSANAAVAYPAHKHAEWPAWSLHGNLYALSADFVYRLRADSIALPIGLVGDDSFIGHLALLDLNPKGRWDLSKLARAVEAGFYYDQADFLSVAFYVNQYRRKMRYARRSFENKMLDLWIREHGLGELPGCVTDLYQAYAQCCGFRWNGVDTLFEWLSLRRIQHIAAGKKGF